jgi:type II secretory ATPase GspE/PulE/Tfp pilus assembly ATPase PilB-like protein
MNDLDRDDDTLIEDLSIPAALTQKIPARICTHYKVIPLNEEDGCLIIAMPKYDAAILEEIALFTDMPVKGIVAPSDLIETNIKKFYGIGAENVEKLRSDDPFPPLTEVIGGEDDNSEASLSRLVEAVLCEACRRRATDIHFEPFGNGLNVRFRIDGVLYDIDMPSDICRFADNIAARIKILAGLDTTEKRRPQDGRFAFHFDNEEIDARVSFLPSRYGESIALRLLPKGVVYELEDLGLELPQRELLLNVLNEPNGIIFLTGPTGSGKSTTLYSCLSHLNRRERKIITIEDPVEYEVAGVTQIQVLPDVGLTFASGLRSMLRHDPDVMMVGEVRDEETARIAVQTALTGHLVLSTLHTNDAISGIARLNDMGIASYLIAASVRCIISQRLIRMICPRCRSLSRLPSELEGMIRKETGKCGPLVVFRGAGCKYCDFTGYYGRQAIFEFLRIDEEIRDLITEGAPAAVMKRVALGKGMKLLQHAGWEKALQGMTTVEEIIRINNGKDTQ